MRSLIAALIVCAAAGASAAAQEPPTPPPPQTQPPEPATPTPAPTPPPTPSSTRALTEDAGIIFFPVKPERTADFEKIIAKLKDALAATDDPVRREQAAGWKVFKAVEPGPNNTALYVFLIDPAVKGTDYAFWKMLYEQFPDDVQQLYRLYTAATAGSGSLLNLKLLQDFKTPD